MLEEAIALVKKQIELYTIQIKNITTHARRQVIENKVKKKLDKKIKIWLYILEILEKQKEEETNEQIK